MTGRRDRTIVPRFIGAASTGLGVVLLAKPRHVDQVSETVVLPTGWVRLLGARYVAQGATQLVWPRPAVMEVSAVIDGVHALSMFALAAARTDYRRPAMLSAFVATAGAAADMLTARRAHQDQR